MKYISIYHIWENLTIEVRGTGGVKVVEVEYEWRGGLNIFKYFCSQPMGFIDISKCKKKKKKIEFITSWTKSKQVKLAPKHCNMMLRNEIEILK